MNTADFYDILDFPHTSSQLRGLAANWAQEVKATWPDIANTYPLPPSLWSKLGQSGVAGIGIDQAYGGQGGGYEDICVCAAEVSFWSKSPGLALSLFIHQLSARFSIANLASPQQKEQYLPQLATGALTAAQAVSEPKTGGSIRHMKTMARKHRKRWVLTGEKSFVTNGPIAGLFITLAVTGERDGKKELSAFLVPAATKGVQVRDSGPLAFLQPSPHGAVEFNEVELSERNLLGEAGKAVDFLSRPFVALEDVLMAGWLVGGFIAFFMCLCRDMFQAGQNTPEKQSLAGKLQAGLIALTNHTAYTAGRTNAPDFLQKSQGFSRAARELALLNLCLSQKLMLEVPIAHDTRTLLTDLQKSLTIRGKVADLRTEKAGRQFLSVMADKDR